MMAYPVAIIVDTRANSSCNPAHPSQRAYLQVKSEDTHSAIRWSKLTDLLPQIERRKAVVRWLPISRLSNEAAPCSSPRH
jgi:hypothetical protein